MLTGAALGRRVVGEGLHAVDQPADAVGLVDDQLGQRRVLGLGAGLQQLGRAADAGQRVLDLVRQHAAQADDRAQAAGRLGPAALDAQAGRDACRVSSTAPSPSGAAAPSASNGGRPKRLISHAALADLAAPPRRRGRAAETSAEPGGRAALNRPRGQQGQALAEQRLGRLVDRHQRARRRRPPWPDRG